MEGTIVVTGGTLGLGYEAALNIAKSYPGYELIIASRKDADNITTKINKEAGHNNTSFQPIDLSSFDSVRSFATRYLQEGHRPIKALVLNAALQFPGEIQFSEDGIEKTVAITHLGHALLFYLLRPQLAPDARIVIVSSGVHDPAQKWPVPIPIFPSAKEVFHPNPETANKDGRERYTTSKLCNVLWMHALARRLQSDGAQSKKQWTVTALDPGLMFGTGLTRDFPAPIRLLSAYLPYSLLPVLRRLMGQQHVRTPSESGVNLARLAAGPDVQGVSDTYYEGSEVVPTSEMSMDEAKQEDLYEVTIKTIAKDPQEEASFRRVYG